MNQYNICIFSCLYFALTTVAFSQSQVYLAYVGQNAEENDWQSDPRHSACVFSGSYKNGRFVKIPDNDYVKTMTLMLLKFPRNYQLNGVNQRGKFVRAVVKSTDSEHLGELGFTTLEIIAKSKTSFSSALLWTRPFAVNILKREKTQITEEIDIVLRKRAEELWVKHLPERSDDERPSSYKLKSPIVERVQNVPGLLTILYPMDIEEYNLNGDGKTAHDDRGSMFFIYSEIDRKIVRSEFGHSEWSFSSSVRTIKPELFFRIKGLSGVYFIGISEGGWEDAGVYGLFDYRTGKELMHCH